MKLYHDSQPERRVLAFTAAFILLIGIGSEAVRDFARQIRPLAPLPVVTPMHAQTIDPTASRAYVAALDVARVFGRSVGCAEADPKLITNVAEEAIKSQIDPRILAATVAIESGCNQYATSSRGAIGLMQIVPKTWKGSYDFEHTYNLLNPRDNLRVGADILGGLIKQYGVNSGLRRYNGLDTNSDAYDAGYVDRITALAAKR